MPNHAYYFEHEVVELAYTRTSAGAAQATLHGKAETPETVLRRIPLAPAAGKHTLSAIDLSAITFDQSPLLLVFPEDCEAEANRAVALGDTAAARPVHADRVHLVEIGHRAIAFGEIADRRDRRDIAVHRIDRFEGDQLGAVRSGTFQQGLEMIEIVMAEDLLRGAGTADALDHRGVIELVGEDHAIGQQPRDRADRRLVGDEARGEDQRRLFAMKVGEFPFERDDRMVGA